MNSQNDLENLIQNTAKPRKEFVHSLHDKMKRESQPNLLSQLSMNIVTFFKGKAGMAMIGVFALFGIGLGVFFTYQYRTMQDYQATNASSAELLAKIQKANANNSVNREIGLPSTTNNSTGALATSDARSLIARYQDPKERGYQFMLSETTYSLGSAASSCKAVASWIIDSGITKMQSAEFFEKNEDYAPSHTRYSQYQGSKIYDLFIKQGNDRIEYYGGSYALVIKNEPSVNMELLSTREDTSSLLNTAPTVDSGTSSRESDTAVGTDTSINKEDDTRVVGKETINGKTYHKISSSYPTYCDMDKNGVSKSNKTTTIVTESLADPDTFIIISDSYYMNSISTQNLIYKSETKRETKKTAQYSEVSSYFTLEGVATKTLDMALKNENQAYYDANISQIKKAGVMLLDPVSDHKISGLYSERTEYISEREKHHSDVAFYPSANDERYKSYLENMKNAQEYRNSEKTAIVRTSYQSLEETQAQYFSIAVYSTNKSALEFLTGIYQSSKLTEEAATTITIDGRPVNVQVFTINSQGMVSPDTGSGSTGSSPDGLKEAPTRPSELLKNRYATFVSGGKLYVIETSSFLPSALPKFTSVLSNSSRFESIVSSLRPIVIN